MNIKIYKYTIEPADVQELLLPGGYNILTVINQYEDVVLYAEVDTDEESLIGVKLYTFGTGHDADLIREKNLIYIGTVSLREGNLVFHFYYERSIYE